jgi:hypothetical protein
MKKANRYNIASKTSTAMAIIMVAICTLMSMSASAQTIAEVKASKKMYEGRWVDKKTKRHLVIVYDGQEYAELNDWTETTGDNSSSVDAYKAWIKNGKLVMPESKTDLRCPYCEIVKKGNALLYRCMSMNTTDKRFIENIWFVRDKN